MSPGWTAINSRKRRPRYAEIAINGVIHVRSLVSEAKIPTVCLVKPISNSGAVIKAICADVVQGLQKVFPDGAMARAMNPPTSVRVADGRVLRVTEIKFAVCIALYMRFGPMTLDMFAWAGMPGADDVLILGCPTPQVLCSCNSVTLI